MNRNRLAVAGIAALAALTFVSGCTAKPTATPTPTPKAAMEILNDAAAKTRGQSFRYTVTYGDMLTGDGARDATGANTQRNVTVKTGTNGLTIVAKVLHVDDKVYAKLDLGALGAQLLGLGALGDRWLLVDLTKVNPNGLSASLIPNSVTLRRSTPTSRASSPPRPSAPPRSRARWTSRSQRPSRCPRPS